MAKRSQRETAVLVMTDLHYGKKTRSFNPDSFCTRLDDLGERMGQIRQLLSTYDFDELVICLLGDVNDGSDIYATQAHHQAISNVEEQAEGLTNYLAPWFRQQKQIWGKVRIEAIPGNHGRVGKFAHECANWDVVAYKYLRMSLKGDVALNLNKPNENLFLRKTKIRNHNYLLYHGHDIRSFGNIPWYGMSLRIARWNTSRLAPFDMVMMGHFHTSGIWPLNRVKMLLAGTMVTDDDWALQTLGWESSNTWWLFGVSDSRFMTWNFAMDV